MRGGMFLDDKTRVFRRLDGRLPARFSRFREVTLGLIEGEVAGCHSSNSQSARGTTGGHRGRSTRFGPAQRASPPHREPKLKTGVFCRGIRSGNMQNCAFCGKVLSRLATWKANDGRFYCGEFCADGGETIEAAAKSRLSEWASAAELAR